MPGSGGPRNSLLARQAIAVRAAPLGGHRKANVVVRGNVISIHFCRFFVPTPFGAAAGNHSATQALPFNPCRIYVSPIILMVELWGTAPQSKESIAQRIQRHLPLSGTGPIIIHVFADCKRGLSNVLAFLARIIYNCGELTRKVRSGPLKSPHILRCANEIVGALYPHKKEIWGGSPFFMRKCPAWSGSRGYITGATQKPAGSFQYV